VKNRRLLWTLTSTEDTRVVTVSLPSSNQVTEATIQRCRKEVPFETASVASIKMVFQYYLTRFMRKCQELLGSIQGDCIYLSRSAWIARSMPLGRPASGSGDTCACAQVQVSGGSVGNREAFQDRPDIPNAIALWLNLVSRGGI